MGYSTNFTGELKFTTDLTAKQLAKVQSFLGEDWREHPEWMPDPKAYLSYIDLKLNEDFSGIDWDGSEKTYGMVESVNLIIREMCKIWVDFGLTGTLEAQGEDAEDRWRLEIGKDGLAKKVKVTIKGRRITCPHCEETFIVENQKAK